MDRQTANKYKNKNVILTTDRGSKYNGLIVSTTPDKVFMKNVVVLNKDESFKATTYSTRGFNFNAVEEIELSQ